MDNNGSYLPIVPYVDLPAAGICQQFMRRGNSLACGCSLRHRMEAELELVPLLENLERGNGGDPKRRLMRASRKRRRKVSREQEEIMEFATNNVIGWDPRRHDKARADELCREMGISRAYYLQWIRDMKLFREAERMDADAAGSLLMLCNSA